MRFGWDKERSCIVVIWEERDLKPYKGPVRHAGRSIGWGTGSNNPAEREGQGPSMPEAPAEAETA